MQVRGFGEEVTGERWGAPAGEGCGMTEQSKHQDPPSFPDQAK